MKLKYKKMIIMISMCTMGIGLVTFSIKGQSGKSTTTVEKNSADDIGAEEVVALKEDQNLLAAVLPTITPIPTLTPELKVTEVVDVLEKDTNKEINKLIKNYLKAKLTTDVKNFKSLVNDVSLLDIDDMERKTKYIEEYQNLSCYTKNGLEEGSYIVYAYHDVKFTSIDTLAPAMNEFYVKTNENGEPYIHLGEIDDDTELYLNSVRESEEVMDLIFNVNEKLQKAVKDDDALYAFYLKLEESAQNVTKNN